jgi:hypothetical protein
MTDTPPEGCEEAGTRSRSRFIPGLDACYLNGEWYSSNTAIYKQAMSTPMTVRHPNPIPPRTIATEEKNRQAASEQLSLLYPSAA